MAGKEDQSRLLLNVVLPRYGPAPCTWDSSALAVNTEAEQQPEHHPQDLAVRLLAAARTWFWLLVLKWQECGHKARAENEGSQRKKHLRDKRANLRISERQPLNN